MARALVEVASDRVPVRLLNTRSEPVTVYAGMEIATLEQAEVPVATVAAGTANCGSFPDEGMQAMLSSVAKDTETELSADEKERFFNVLSSYADVFASSVSDLGRTAMLKYHIDTGDTPPIRQSVRRLPPQRRDEVQAYSKRC